MILLTGATGYTGRFLLHRMAAGAEPLRCIVRASSDCSQLSALGVEYHIGDLTDPGSVRTAFIGADKVVHLAHIRYAPTILECVDASVEHVVLVSSLRRFSRVLSPSVEEVIAGEECARAAGIPCTILRPAMIYGPGDDRNIGRLAMYLQRRSWIPIFGSGEYLQQPVYVEDVVDVVLAALDRPRSRGRSYNVAGAEKLTYNCLIDRVGGAVGVRPRKVHIPVQLTLAGLWCMERMGINVGVEGEQVLRLQESKAFSIDAAQEDLDYAPLTFAAGLQRIYAGGEVHG